MDKMTPEYKVTREKIRAVINESGLPEMQMYALLSTCMTEVAHKHNCNNFDAISIKLAIVSKTMLEAVDKALPDVWPWPSATILSVAPAMTY